MDFSAIKKEMEKDSVLIEEKVFNEYYVPLAEHCRKIRNDKIGDSNDTFTIYIQGAQGSGKTVLTKVIWLILAGEGHSVAGCSIDDFYLSYAARKVLAEQHPGSPFYAVRGTLGTHRHAELYDMLQRVKRGEEFLIPHFDKSLHAGKGDIVDRVTKIKGRQDFFLFEGWSLFAPAISVDEFLGIMEKDEYVRDLFDQLDPERKYFIDVLEYAKAYQKIWDLADSMVILEAEDIKLVTQWRLNQEETTKKQSAGKGMTPDEVVEFVKPYIPVTQLIAHKKSHSRPGVILSIGENQRPQGSMREI
tara:strand:+ start:154 stop:1062 length:909 start_codon:yes stop_codon:yes gene_type:complete